MKIVKFKYILGLFLLLVAFSSCKDDSSSEEKEEEAMIINYKKDRIKLKIEYYADTASKEKFKEEWTFDDKKRIVSYIKYEDGAIIEKNSDYSYIKEDGKYKQSFTKSFYSIGYSLPNKTDRITNTYLDSTYNKILQEKQIGLYDSTRTEYEYNNVGLEIRKTTYKDGKMVTDQSEYNYPGLVCEYTESSYILNKWEECKHKIEYLNPYYNLISSETIYDDSNKERERTQYVYDKMGRITQKEYYYEGELEQKFTNFEYTENGVTYINNNLYEEESTTIKEVYLK
ncbi:MAG TPA: hypothetical protein PKW49_07210 [Paludibacteraceae bacterium]|nr:hypothetical protein [Paludibacteraceae bacterium]HQF50203.1 hypothetical protein [Paludibacteraceae bacterium]